MQYDIECIDDVGHVQKVSRHFAVAMDATEHHDANMMKRTELTMVL